MSDDLPRRPRFAIDNRRCLVTWGEDVSITFEYLEQWFLACEIKSLRERAEAKARLLYGASGLSRGFIEAAAKFYREALEWQEEDDIAEP